ncbi:MAG: succinyl-diaminopimelate desuccinylase [Alphaproteobacteria bacterium]|nr:succinyl-diaminopimelate desuccinylase [Alphaproteobacteria bacterium]
MSFSVPKTDTVADLTDPVRLTQKLIRCQSITPMEGGALNLLEHWLSTLGFTCRRLSFSEEGTADVENLFAVKTVRGTENFCFAGHTDVVPAGNPQNWHHDPFQGVVFDGVLTGRGAVDMKGAIAAFVAAVARSLKNNTPPEQTLSFLITGDEEGVAVNGTRKVLKWLEDQGIKLDFCLVGEPSSVEKVGDTLKIGRRGSLNTRLTVLGKQGHVAFPEKADNPLPKLVSILHTLKQGPKETKSHFFDPSNLELTSIDVGNQTTNLIPEKATARFNIRFNDQQTGKGLSEWIKEVCARHAENFTTEFEFSGEAEFLEPNEKTAHISSVIQEVTGLVPDMTTAGATSDARFIRHHCPVVEFGLIGRTMHQTNECVPISDLERLTRIYGKIFKTTASKSS